MAWTKLKDIFATKKEINEVRDSLSRFDDIVVSSGIGSVGFSWQKLPNEYRLYFHVDGIKVAYLTATFPEQRLSLSREYPSIDSRNLKSIYFQVYDDGYRYHFQAIVKMKNGLAKTLTLITWQQLSLSRSTHAVKFTGKGSFYGVCSRAGVVSVGGWLASNSGVWTTVATGLPPAAISTFIVVPTDDNNNAMKARVTQSGTLDIRLIKPSALECYGDFNIAYIAKQLSLSQKVFNSLVYNSNLDDAPFGVSCWGRGCINSPSDYGVVLVFGRDAYIFQIACVTYNIDGNSNMLYIRRNINGTGYTTWRPVD